jgi:hypothetical protein
VKIVPGVFDQLLLIGVNRVRISYSDTDRLLGCFDFVQQSNWV